MEATDWIIEPRHETGFRVHDGRVGIWRKYLNSRGQTQPVGSFFDTREEAEAAVEKYSKLCGGVMSERGEELRRLREAATPGEWRLVPRFIGPGPDPYECDCEIRGNTTYAANGQPVGSVDVARLRAGFVWYQGDKAFITFAANNAIALADELALLRAENAALREQLTAH